MNNFRFKPNLKNERLLAAGDHKLKVCGIVDALFTYNGRTKLMQGLVMPDFTNKIIVSHRDAKNIGALSLNRADTQVLKVTNSRKRSRSPPTTTSKRTRIKRQSEHGPAAQRTPVGLPQNVQNINVNSNKSNQCKTKSNPSNSLPVSAHSTLEGQSNTAQVGPARPSVSQSKTVPRPCPAGLPNAAQTGLADTQSVNSHDVNKQNIAAQDTPEGLSPSIEKQQKVPKPQVPPPPLRSESDRDRFELILSPKSKVKIEAVIQKWNKKYPCLSDTLSTKPMIGPAMKINLKKELAVQIYLKKAMTAVLIPRHYKQASNELIEELLNSKVIRRVKKLAVPKFRLDPSWLKK